MTLIEIHPLPLYLRCPPKIKETLGAQSNKKTSEQKNKRKNKLIEDAQTHNGMLFLVSMSTLANIKETPKTTLEA